MKRHYPKIEAKTWRWILALVLAIGSFYEVSFLFYALKVKNEIIYALAISILCLLSLLVVDKKFIKKIFLPLKMKDILYIIIGLGFSIVCLLYTSDAADE